MFQKLIFFVFSFFAASVLLFATFAPEGASWRLAECPGFDDCPGHWEEISHLYDSQGNDLSGELKCFQASSQECRCLILYIGGCQI